MNTKPHTDKMQREAAALSLILAVIAFGLGAIAGWVARMLMVTK